MPLLAIAFAHDAVVIISARTTKMYLETGLTIKQTLLQVTSVRSVIKLGNQEFLNLIAYQIVQMKIFYKIRV